MLSVKTKLAAFTTTIALFYSLASWGTGNSSDIGNLTTVNWVTAFDQKMQSAMRLNKIPGMAMALVEGNKSLLQKGYGLRDVENNLAVDENTLFNIASTHKSITALLIAKLVDEKVLDWDTPVVNYYPSFALSNAASTNKVTLNHLLSMSSGIPDDAEGQLPDNGTAIDVFNTAQDALLLGAPGEEFSYSNISSSLAGYIGVIASTGSDQALYEDYSKLLKANILDSIGMTRSTIYASKARQDGNIAKTYSLSSTGSFVHEPSEDVDGDMLAPSGSLKSSVKEMALYLSTHLNDGIAPNKTRIVSKANILKTRQPIIEGYGLGWESVSYRNTLISQHTGSFDGFVSVILLIPKKNLGLVLLANSEQAAGDLTDQAHKILINTLIDHQHLP